jgi:hypothetical protein
VFDDEVPVVAGHERSGSPFDMNPFYARKPEVTLLDGISEDRLDLPILLFYPTHRRVKNELAHEQGG